MSVMIALCDKKGEFLEFQHNVIVDVVPRVGETVQCRPRKNDYVEATVLKVVHGLTHEQDSNDRKHHLSFSGTSARVYIFLDV